MKNRREFLKTAATGAVLLGSHSKLGLAAAVEKHVSAATSKVVVARDAALQVQDAQLTDQRVLALLDKAMAAYTGHTNPAQAWQTVIPRGKIIGIKINGLGGRGISSHAVLVHAICERLQQSGVPAANIIVWDRNARDLRACGMTISTDAGRIRCYGSDTAGYEDQETACGSASLRLSKILTRQCDMVISVPILKDHNMSGLTFTMKNMYGVIDKPFRLHGNNCNPGIADLNALPVIRDKVSFTIGDALTSVYEGGPGFQPQYLWHPGTLIVGHDRVAVDSTAWQILDRKRVQAGLPTLKADGREPLYIATAADAAHRLGTNNPQHIHLVEV